VWYHSECVCPNKDKSDDKKDNFDEELECVFNQSLKFDMKIFIDFTTKAGRKYIPNQ